MDMRDRMIVALDYSEMSGVEKIVEELGESVSFYKVGLELYLNTDGKVLDYLKERGKKIFLDLKFHDIPNTTTMASIFAVKRDIAIFNVHSGGGRKMMQSVVEKVREINRATMVIGVTILTSFSDEELYEIYKSKLGLKELVLNMAKVTQESGMNGVVCSAWEAKEIKRVCGESFKTICPGIRLVDSSVDDQKRVMTPKEAIKNSCDYIVVGRAITNSSSPKETAERVLDEMMEGYREICC